MDREIDLEKMEREILERGEGAMQPGGVVHDFAREWWDREEHQRMIRRERDLAFQIRMMDWMIILFLLVLALVMMIGSWAVWMMLVV